MLKGDKLLLIGMLNGVKAEKFLNENRIDSYFAFFQTKKAEWDFDSETSSST